EIRLDLDEEVTRGELILVVDPELIGDPASDVLTSVHVFDDNGRQWTDRHPTILPTGEVAFTYRAPTDDPVGRVAIVVPLGVSVGVVGVGGVTVTAAAAVAVERGLVAAEAARRAAAAAAGPPLLPSAPAPHQRTILDPG